MYQICYTTRASYRYYAVAVAADGGFEYSVDRRRALRFPTVTAARQALDRCNRVWGPLSHWVTSLEIVFVGDAMPVGDDDPNGRG